MSAYENKNAAFALKCTAAKRVTVSPPPLSLIGGQAFTLGILFRCERIKGECILIRQKEIFVMGIRGGIPYYLAPGLGSFWGQLVAIEEDAWNAVYVAFDPTQMTLRLFVNGVCIGEWKTAQGNNMSFDFPYLLGETLQGHIQWVRLYDQCLTAEEISANPFRQPEEGMPLCLDFTQKQPLDRGASQFPILQEATRETALRPAEHGAAYVRNSGLIQERMSGGSYTILQSLYLQRTNANRFVSFSSGSVEVVFYPGSTEFGKVLATLNLPVAGQSQPLCITGSAPYDEWFQAACTYDSTAQTISLFVNGQLAGQLAFTMPPPADAPIRLGGDAASYFPGFIKETAVFSRVLSQSELAAYIQTPIGLSDDALVALYSFAMGEAVDRKSNLPIDLADPFRVVNLSEGPTALAAKTNGAACPPDAETPAAFPEGIALWGRVLPHSMKDNTHSILYSHGTPESAGRIQMGLFQQPGENGVRLYCSIGEFEAVLTKDSPIPFGKWLHFLIRYQKSANQMEFFANGAPLGTITVSTGIENAVHVAVGNSADRTKPFVGWIDQLAVYNSNLSGLPPIGNSNAFPDLSFAGLQALYSFNGQAVEQKHGQPLSLTGNAALAPICVQDSDSTYLTGTGDGSAKVSNAPALTQIFADGTYSILARIYPIKGQEVPYRFLIKACTSDSPYILTVHLYDRAGYQTLAFSGHGNVSYPANQQQVRLPYNQWSTLLIVSNQCKIGIYVNGALIRSGSFQKRYHTIDFSSAQILIGSEQDGRNPYLGKIAWVSLFNKALNSQEISQYSLFASPLSADGLVSSCAFTHDRAIDEKSGQPVELTGEALLKKHLLPQPVLSSTNLVRALHTGAGGCARDENAAVVSNTLSHRSYTVCAAVWIPPQIPSSGVLMDFTPEGQSGSQGLCAALRRDTGIRLEIKQGTLLQPSIEIRKEEASGWLQIALVYRAAASQLSVFLNGELRATYSDVPANVPFQTAYFGNDSTLQQPCPCYLDSVAVYSRDYSQAEIEAIRQNQAFLFDGALTALYDFSTAKPVELLSGRELLLTDGAAAMLRENTQQEACSPLSPPLGTIRDYKPALHWVAYVAYLAGMGLPLLAFSVSPRPDTLTGGSGGIPGIPAFPYSVADFLVNGVYQLYEVHHLALESPQIKAESLENAFLALTQNGLIQSLTKIFFPSHSGLMQDIWGWYLKSQALAPVGQAIRQLAQKAVERIGSLPDRPELPYQINVKAITFHHSKEDPKQGALTAALGLRPDRDYKAPVPEWTLTGNSADNPSVAVYASDSVFTLPYLSVEIACTTSASLNLVEILKAKSLGDGILGTGSEPINIEDGTQNFKLNLHGHKLSKSRPGWHKTVLEWSYTADGAPQYFTTDHSIYLLSHKPVSPWSMTDPNRYLTLAALKTHEKILDGARRQAAPVPDRPAMEDIAAYTCAWLWSSKLFTYSKTGKNSFTSFSENGTLMFDRDAFDKQVDAATAESPIPITALDCSCIVADSTRLEGHSGLGISKLVTDLSSFRIESEATDPLSVPLRGKEWDYPLPLRLNPVKPLGGDSFQPIANYSVHYAAMTPADQDTPIQDQRVFDAYLAFKDFGLTQIHSNKPFSDQGSTFTGGKSPYTYRESLFESASRCVPCFFENWIHEPVTPNAPDVIGAKKSGGLIHALPAKQGNIDGWILQALEPTALKEPCGSLSWEAIRQIVGKAAAALFTGKWRTEDFTGCLNAVAESLYIGIPGDLDSLNAAVRNLFQQTPRTIEAAAQALRSPKPEEEQITGLLTLLVHQLSNAFYAIRLGDPVWIHAMDSAFDPAGWVYLQATDNSCAITGTFDAFAYPLHSEASLYPLFQSAVPAASGFYLTDETDAARLQPLFQQEKLWLDQEIPWFAMGSFRQQDGTDFHFLYSSSNRFALPKKQQIRTVSEPVYVRLPDSPSKWTLLWTAPSLKTL